MYKKIAFGLKGLIESRDDVFSNYSIAGRSAGGGIAIHLALTHGLNVNGLNIACPGFNYNALLENGQFNENINNKDIKKIPTRLCHTINDQKVSIDESDKLAELLKGFKNFQYYRIEKATPEDEINHRFQLELLSELV